jgi:ribonuclease PH
MRPDNRFPDQLRSVKFELDFISYPEGSVLISQGNTRVLCNASIEHSVPRWMQIQNIPGGWITAEYAMLPRATHTRTPRETASLSGRTQEIRRLIGRSMRAAVDLEKLGSRTITLDCDVLQADGGTRTAAITGSYISLVIALDKLIRQGVVTQGVLSNAVAAVSVGIVDGECRLDLCYEEDSKAQADMNIVMTGKGQFIEIQGTAEKEPFSRAEFEEMLSLAEKGIRDLLLFQTTLLRERIGNA